MHKAYAVGLQPAHDPFGLLDQRGRRRGEWPGDNFTGCAKRFYGGRDVGAGGDDRRPREPSIPNDMHVPSTIWARTPRDDLGEIRESTNAMSTSDAAQRGSEPIPPRSCLFEPLRRREFGHPRRDHVGHGGHVRSQQRPSAIGQFGVLRNADRSRARRRATADLVEDTGWRGAAG